LLYHLIIIDKLSHNVIFSFVKEINSFNDNIGDMDFANSLLYGIISLATYLLLVTSASINTI
jgi:hypothetical protein